MTPRITVVVAVADNGVIGRDNGLPWHLPADLAHFKRLTLGKPIVMGRRTFTSIGRALPGRHNVVVSSDRAFQANGITVVPGFDEALASCGPVAEVMVIGGAAIFAAALPRATRVHLTRVRAAVPGDVYFPELEPAACREVTRLERPADDANAYALTFLTLERVGPRPTG